MLAAIARDRCPRQGGVPDGVHAARGRLPGALRGPHEVYPRCHLEQLHADVGFRRGRGCRGRGAFFQLPLESAQVV